MCSPIFADFLIFIIPFYHLIVNDKQFTATQLAVVTQREQVNSTDLGELIQSWSADAEFEQY